jgi:hypothetical protein
MSCLLFWYLGLILPWQANAPACPQCDKVARAACCDVLHGPSSQMFVSILLVLVGRGLLLKQKLASILPAAQHTN